MSGSIWLLVRSGSMDVNDSPYDYIPTRSVAIIFIVLFALSTLTHTSQALYTRTWWLLPTAVLAGSVEVLGWSGRLWSSYSPSLIHPFQIQITSTILAPTPLVAANFIILGKIIQRLGPVYSRLSPMWYSIVFCSADIISLVIQGVGGGMASAAADANKDARPGANVMLGGIVFQLASISLYALFALEFFARYLHDHPLRSAAKPIIGDSGRSRGDFDNRLKFMSCALLLSTLCLFIRAVYRTIELADGWDGRIITTQVYFNVLDGAMVVIAIFAFNFAHPGFLLVTPKPHDLEKRLSPSPERSSY